MSPVDWLVDCVIAAGAFGFGILQLSLSDDLFVPDDFTRMMLGLRSATPPIVSVAGTFLTCLPLIVRRKLPWIAFLASLLAWCAIAWPRTVVALSLIGPVVALFTLALECPRTQSLAAGVIALLAVLIDPISVNAPRIATLSLVQNCAIVVAVTFAGYALHSREQYVESLKERAVESERLRRSEAERAISAARAERNEALQRVEAQRVQIARELHDITAHSLSAISVQASAAERLLDDDPSAARDAIKTVRATAKESLDEIRALVGVLRSEQATDGDARTAPMRGTADLGGVVSYLDAAGIRCEAHDEGYDRSTVPILVDLALGRILREAATNIVKHADASCAWIELRSEPGRAILRIEDDGCGVPLSAPVRSSEGFARVREGIGEAGVATSASEGNGILGMYERVSLLGGSMVLAASDKGGLLLDVEVPTR